MSSFDSFDWAGNDAWQSIERNLYFSSSDASENARVLLKRKRKFFKANIDPDFEWTEEPGHNQTYGNKQQQQASESPKPATSSATPPPSSASSTSSPRATSSSTGFLAKYGVYVSWVQLALHALIIVNVLTYLLPLAGVDQQEPSFFRCIQLNLLVQGIYLLRQHGRPAWNAEYGRRLFVDEQAHFFFLGVVLINATPSLMFLLPFFSRSVLFVCGGLKQVLPSRAPRIYNAISKYLELAVARYAEVYSMNALIEVMAGFSLIINLLTPQRNFMMLMGYWQYLRIRYMLSADSKRAFGIVRAKLDGWISHSACPAVVRNGYAKLLDILAQYTDQEAMAAQAQQQTGGLMSKCSVM